MIHTDKFRDFAPIRSRARTIKKPRIARGTHAPLLEWLAKVIRRANETPRVAHKT
jgi:hypothetical protein